MQRSTLIIVLAAFLVLGGAIIVAQTNAPSTSVSSDRESGTRIDAPGTRVETDADKTRIQAPGVDITVPREKTAP
ncbi:hypothetical protein [Hyphomicrobium sp. LHD-15]|uniref:hypothetical protein n=1 Tax=Hyphomicrobium sp. LHD-15 TaxID=3072142 RepID=UPI00280F3D76|nr:hypothetical protein [Hyphomicrobium sp. LHD-15]MDQ8697522.1 hypothetical protein [Hyphomicrobium sp. LHD-15]